MDSNRPFGCALHSDIYRSVVWATKISGAPFVSSYGGAHELGDWIEKADGSEDLVKKTKLVLHV